MKFNDFIVSEEKVRLDPKCWTGKKIGNPKTKVKGGVRVNNCVPAESVEEDLSRRGFLKGMGAAAVAGAAGGAKDVSAQSITSSEWNHAKMVRMVILYYFCKNEYPNALFCAEVKQSLNKFARS
jgi:hypothetical protein